MQVDLAVTAVWAAAPQPLAASRPNKSLWHLWPAAIATVHGMDYLLSWNCKHIANAGLRG
jgi:hypothetical protein